MMNSERAQRPALLEGARAAREPPLIKHECGYVISPVVSASNQSSMDLLDHGTVKGTLDILALSFSVAIRVYVALSTISETRYKWRTASKGPYSMLRGRTPQSLSEWMIMGTPWHHNRQHFVTFKNAYSPQTT